MEQTLIANNISIDVDNIFNTSKQKKFHLFKKKKNKTSEEINNNELKDVLQYIIANQNTLSERILELSNKALTDSNANNTPDRETIIDVVLEELKVLKMDEDAKNTSVRLYPSTKEKLEELYKMYPDFNRQDILNQLILEGYNKYKKI